ncbi:TPA: glycosyltransferase, partial [Escherichia coli]|nr:glycosyltransferase [Escherichia coli]
LVKRFFCYYPLSMLLFLYDYLNMRLPHEKY